MSYCQHDQYTYYTDVVDVLVDTITTTTTHNNDPYDTTHADVVNQELSRSLLIPRGRKGDVESEQFGGD